MTLWQDLRFALRLLVKDHWFTVAAVSALALGVGANTTVFTFVNAALLRGLPYDGADRIVTIDTRDVRGRQRGVSIADYEDWRSAQSFDSMTLAWTFGSSVNDDSGQAPDRYIASRVYSNIFQVIRQQPILGRNFNADDDRPGREPVVILAYSMWQSRYGRDPSILGKKLFTSGQRATVIGVMPPEMKFPPNADLWVPVAQIAPELRDRRRNVRNFQAIGRLKPGVTVQAAQAELSTIGVALAQQYPDTNKDLLPRVRSWDEAASGPQIRLVFWSLMGAVAFVLLIACANVANLLLARAAHRSPEISVRVALGATRGQLVRQLLVESLMLALLSGAVGLVLSIVSVRLFDTVLPDGKPYYWAFTLDPVVFVFLAVVCVLTAVIFGLAPALHVSKTDVNEVLKEGGRSGGGIRARRWANALIVGDLALTLVLLAGAGFMMRSFMVLYRLDLGVDTSNMITMRLGMPPDRYPTTAAIVSFVERLEDRVAAMPEIQGGGVTTNAPLGFAALVPIAVEGRSGSGGDSQQITGVVGVGARYLEALRLRPVRGRLLAVSDGRPGYDNVVVNLEFVAKYFPGEDSLGQRVRFVTDTLGGPPLPGADHAWTIVGIVPNVRQRGYDRDPDPVVYTPLTGPLPGLGPRDLGLVVRSRLGLAPAVARLREEMRGLDPAMPLASIQTLDASIALQRWPFRVFGSMFAIFAGIALLLSAIGLYAITAHSVTLRTREIGVRMALGARAQDILWLFARRAVVHLSLGLAVGLAGAVAVGRLLQSLLVQTSSTDLPTLGLIAVILVAVGAVASLWPAQRATRLDPNFALRHE
jgi:predicted permease